MQAFTIQCIDQRLQHMLLPTGEELQQIQALDIACYMEPSDEVGGDYYDVLQHNGQIKIGIGDVTGHGLESGVVMLMTQAIVRALVIVCAPHVDLAHHGRREPAKNCLFVLTKQVARSVVDDA